MHKVSFFFSRAAFLETFQAAFFIRLPGELKSYTQKKVYQNFKSLHTQTQQWTKYDTYDLEVLLGNY